MTGLRCFCWYSLSFIQRKASKSWHSWVCQFSSLAVLKIAKMWLIYFIGFFYFRPNIFTTINTTVCTLILYWCQFPKISYSNSFTQWICVLNTAFLKKTGKSCSMLVWLSIHSRFNSTNTWPFKLTKVIL